MTGFRYDKDAYTIDDGFVVIFCYIFGDFFHGYVENRCQYRGSVLCKLVCVWVFVFRPSPEPRSSRLGVILGRDIPRLNPRV